MSALPLQPFHHQIGKSCQQCQHEQCRHIAAVNHAVIYFQHIPGRHQDQQMRHDAKHPYFAPCGPKFGHDLFDGLGLRKHVYDENFRKELRQVGFPTRHNIDYTITKSEADNVFTPVRIAMSTLAPLPLPSAS